MSGGIGRLKRISLEGSRGVRFGKRCRGIEFWRDQVLQGLERDGLCIRTNPEPSTSKKGLALFANDLVFSLLSFLYLISRLHTECRG